MTNTGSITGPPTIIIYGGAFDPPHQGHIDCVHRAGQEFPHAKIIITPGLEPAGTEGQHKETVASFSDRIRMAKAAFDSVLEPGRVEVSEIESELPRPNYSIQTLKCLQKHYSGQRIALMMGLDQFKVFHRWKDPGAILGLCDLLVMRRDSGESLVKAADVTARHLGLEVEWSDDYKSACFNNEGGARLFMLDFKTSNAASSEIKFRLHLKKPIPESWVPTQVLELISSGHLYENVPREDKC